MHGPGGVTSHARLCICVCLVRGQRGQSEQNGGFMMKFGGNLKAPISEPCEEKRGMGGRERGEKTEKGSGGRQ